MGMKLSKTDSRLLGILLFLAKFTALSLPLYLIAWSGAGLLPLQHSAAAGSVWMMNALGLEAHSERLLVYAGSGPFIFYIGPDCTGWKSMLCLAALIIATAGVSMKKRLLGVAIGIPLVYLGNIMRIVAVVLAEMAYGYDAAMLIHDWLWQAGLLALVLGIWLVWLRSGWLKKHIIALAKE